MRFSRLDFVALFLRGFRHPHHHGNIRAINIRIHQPDFRAGLRQCHGQIGGDRGFTDSAFPTRHRNNMFDAGQQGILGRRISRTRVRCRFVTHLSILRFHSSRVCRRKLYPVINRGGKCSKGCHP